MSAPPPPACRRCGDPFDEEHPPVARGLHRACYLKAWHRFELNLYPALKQVKPALLAPNRHWPQWRSAGYGDEQRCRECVTALRLLVSSAMRGMTVARECPHVGRPGRAIAS